MRTRGVRGVRRPRRGCESTSGLRQPVDAVLQEQERGQRGTARVHGARAGGERATAQELQPWGGADVNALGAENLLDIAHFDTRASIG